MVEDVIMSRPRTLTLRKSCRWSLFGAAIIMSSVLFSFSRKLWSDIRFIASSKHRSFAQQTLQINVQHNLIFVGYIEERSA